MTTSELRTRDKRYIWHPFTQMAVFEDEENLVIERGEGRYLYDTDGNKYFDGYSSLWVNLHGHNIPEINQAITDQLHKIAHSTLLGSSNIPSIELAQRLVEHSPEGLEKVFYSDNGSTAVEVALKMAYQYYRCKNPQENRKKYLVLKNAYHGDTIGSVSVGGIDIFHAKFKELLFETIVVQTPDCYRCPWGNKRSTCDFDCTREAVRVIEEHHAECVAFVMEPLIQGAAGMLTQPPGYMKRIEEVCRARGLLLIVDEVATGFGRTGKLFACEHEGVRPDLMTVAKGISGGYLPLAATLATDEIYRVFLGRYDEFKTFFHGHSYTGNQLACAAGVASFDLLIENEVVEKVAENAAYFTEILRPLWQHPNVGCVRQRGFMVGIELVADKATKTPFPFEKRTGHRVLLEARKRGLLTRPLGDTITLVPPLTTTKEELKWMVDVIRECLDILSSC